MAVAVHRPAATVLTGPLAWEPPYAVASALKKKKRPKKKKLSIVQKINIDVWVPFLLWTQVVIIRSKEFLLQKKRGGVIHGNYIPGQNP